MKSLVAVFVLAVVFALPVTAQETPDPAETIEGLESKLRAAEERLANLIKSSVAKDADQTPVNSATVSSH